MSFLLHRVIVRSNELCINNAHKVTCLISFRSHSSFNKERNHPKGKLLPTVFRLLWWVIVYSSAKVAEFYWSRLKIVFYYTHSY